MLKDSSKRLPKPKVSKQEAPSQTAKNLGSPARVILSTLLIFLASQVVAAFIVGLAMAIIQHTSHPDVQSSVAGQFVYILIAEGLAVWLALAILKRRGLKPAFIGLGRKPNKNDLAKAAIGFAVFYAILITIGLIINAFAPDLTDQKQNVGFDSLDGGFQTLLAFIALVIIPPLGEEILVRGYLYSGLRKVWNFVPSLLVTSIFFGTAHLQLGSGTALVWAAAIDTFLLSVVLVYLREKTGALYAGMLIHMLNNMLAFIVVIK